VTEWLEQLTRDIEPLRDPAEGPRYRCSATLVDGTHLPCVVVQPKAQRIALARRRLGVPWWKLGLTRGAEPSTPTLEAFVAGGDRVADYEISSVSPSRFAIPIHLLSKIRGETSMAWTGWVMRMRDGRPFSYGSSFRMEFFHLPDGYEFADVAEVINHSYVDASGAIRSLHHDQPAISVYRSLPILRERVFFTCYVNGI
jgi:hypothetical protein